MCGFGVEVRRDGPADREALERMGAVLEPRGPDGSGLWTDGGAGMVHRRLAIIDLSQLGAQPMRDGDTTIVFNGCIYNHHELRARADRARPRVQVHERHRGAAEGLGAVGRGHAPPPQGHVRVRAARGLRAHGAGARSARRQAALPGRCRRRPARGLDAPGAGGGRRDRHARGPRGTAPLPELALDRARPAHDPARRAEAAAGHADGRRARRPAPPARLLGPAVRASPRRRGLAGRDARGAAARGQAAHGRRRARRHPALGRPGLVADRRPAGARGPARVDDVLDRLRGRRRALRRRVRVLRPRRARVRDRPSPDADRPPPADRRAAAGHRGHERADGLARLRRVLAALRSCPARAQGRPVRAGRRRGARRLFLVSAVARRPGNGLDTYAASFFDRDDAGVRELLADGARRRRLTRLRPATGSRARAPRRPSTVRCASTPR